MKNKEKKTSTFTGKSMMKLLTANEVIVVSGGKGRTPSGGGNPSTNIPRR